MLVHPVYRRDSIRTSSLPKVKVMAGTENVVKKNLDIEHNIVRGWR